MGLKRIDLELISTQKEKFHHPGNILILLQINLY